jgi:thymidylate synthase
MGFLKLRSSRLEWMQVMRSNDLFRGLPHNIVQFTALQDMVAGWLGVDVGSYHHVTDSLHVYERDLDAVRGSVLKVPHQTDSPSFALDRPTWITVTADVMRRLDEMTVPGITAERLRELAVADDLPHAYEQAIRIIAADAARRRGWYNLAETCAEACTTSILRTLWTRWAARNGLAVRPGN